MQGPLIYDKSDTILQWGKKTLKNDKWYNHMEKNETTPTVQKPQKIIPY